MMTMRTFKFIVDLKIKRGLKEMFYELYEFVKVCAFESLKTVHVNLYNSIWNHQNIKKSRGAVINGTKILVHFHTFNGISHKRIY